MLRLESLLQIVICQSSVDTEQAQSCDKANTLIKLGTYMLMQPKGLGPLREQSVYY